MFTNIICCAIHHVNENKAGQTMKFKCICKNINALCIDILLCRKRECCKIILAMFNKTKALIFEQSKLTTLENGVDF
jgi:hypothetical protein